MNRIDGRAADQIRKVTVTTDFIAHAEGSVLFESGDTKVICTASVEPCVPQFKKGSGEGWVTAEYSMLPRATNTRNQRDINKLKQSPRSVEIQRLIARSLRAGVDLRLLGENSIVVDCDVIQADGGTRTASITGGFIALSLACYKMLESGILKVNPIVKQVAAVSVGVVDGECLLDLCYIEDSQADVDMNIVMTDAGEYIELQGTGEHRTFTNAQLLELLRLGKIGTEQVFAIQNQLLARHGV